MSFREKKTHKLEVPQEGPWNFDFGERYFPVFVNERFPPLSWTKLSSCLWPPGTTRETDVLDIIDVFDSMPLAKLP